MKKTIWMILMGMSPCFANQMTPTELKNLKPLSNYIDHITRLDAENAQRPLKTILSDFLTINQIPHGRADFKLGSGPNAFQKNLENYAEENQLNFDVMSGQDFQKDYSKSLQQLAKISRDSNYVAPDKYTESDLNAIQGELNSLSPNANGRDVLKAYLEGKIKAQSLAEYIGENSLHNKNIETMQKQIEAHKSELKQKNNQPKSELENL